LVPNADSSDERKLYSERSTLAPVVRMLFPSLASGTGNYVLP